MFFVLKHCSGLLFQHICELYDANLCCPRFPTRTTFFFFCTVIQKRNKSVRAQAVRDCAARAWRFGTFHNHESHVCSRIRGMARTTMQVCDAMAALGDDLGRDTPQPCVYGPLDLQSLGQTPRHAAAGLPLWFGVGKESLAECPEPVLDRC